MKKIRQLPFEEHNRLHYVPNAPDGYCYFFTDPETGIEWAATEEELATELKEIRDEKRQLKGHN